MVHVGLGVKSSLHFIVHWGINIHVKNLIFAIRRFLVGLIGQTRPQLRHKSLLEGQKVTGFVATENARCLSNLFYAVFCPILAPLTKFVKSDEK